MIPAPLSCSEFASAMANNLDDAQFDNAFEVRASISSQPIRFFHAGPLESTPPNPITAKSPLVSAVALELACTRTRNGRAAVNSVPFSPAVTTRGLEYAPVLCTATAYQDLGSTPPRVCLVGCAFHWNGVVTSDVSGSSNAAG